MHTACLQRAHIGYQRILGCLCEQIVKVVHVTGDPSVNTDEGVAVCSLLFGHLGQGHYLCCVTNNINNYRCFNSNINRLLIMTHRYKESE